MSLREWKECFVPKYNMLEGEFEGNVTEESRRGENLLGKIKSAVMLFGTTLDFSKKRYPTFDDLMFSSYSKTSINNSHAIPKEVVILEEGR